MAMRLPLRKFSNPAQHELDLVGGLDRAGGIRIGPDLEHFARDELMPVTPRGTPVLASHRASNAHHPGPEPIGLFQVRRGFDMLAGNTPASGR